MSYPYCIIIFGSWTYNSFSEFLPQLPLSQLWRCFLWRRRPRSTAWNRVLASQRWEGAFFAWPKVEKLGGERLRMEKDNWKSNICRCWRGTFVHKSSCTTHSLNIQKESHSILVTTEKKLNFIKNFHTYEHYQHIKITYPINALQCVFYSLYIFSHLMQMKAHTLSRQIKWLIFQSDDGEVLKPW